MIESTVRRDFFLLLVLILLCGDLSSCHKAGGNSPPPPASCSISGPNVMGITIGQQTVCGQNGYVNEPCVSVKICSPGTTNCQTIDNILLDTGSYGLRIFKSVITVPLTQVNVAGFPLAECALFGTGAEWGEVQSADVYLGGEPKANVSIQTIDSSFGSLTGTSCAASQGVTVGTSPSSDGFNGILGVGVFAHDCDPGGNNCTSVNNGMYYTCNGGNCATSPGVTLANQVANPVSVLPTDNNGVLLQFGDVSASGAASQAGCMVIGIGTQSNNTTGGVVAYPASNLGFFTVNYSGTNNAQSFIDSGSNGIFFPNGPAACSSSGVAPGFYCPTSTVSATATNKASGGNPQASVSFSIANASNLISSGNLVFDNLAGSAPAGEFDWGLPFFLGRTVFVGIQNKVSPLGTGPFWAY